MTSKLGAAITNARPERHNTLGPRGIAPRADPLEAIVVRPQQAMANHMLELRHRAQRALELSLRQIQGVVMDRLARRVEGVQEDAHFAQVSAGGVSMCVHPSLSCEIYEERTHCRAR